MRFPTPRLTTDQRDKASPVWDMSQERAFLETLLNHRTNFFIVFFSAVIAGTLGATEQWQTRLLLSLGALIAMLMYATILRAEQKLSIALRYLSRDRTHPVRITDRAAGPPSARRLLSVWVPFICCGVLLFGVVLAWLDKLPIRQSRTELVGIVFRQSTELAAAQSEIRGLTAQLRDVSERLIRIEAKLGRDRDVKARRPATR